MMKMGLKTERGLLIYLSKKRERERERRGGGRGDG